MLYSIKNNLIEEVDLSNEDKIKELLTENNLYADLETANLFKDIKFRNVVNQDNKQLAREQWLKIKNENLLPVLKENFTISELQIMLPFFKSIVDMELKNYSKILLAHNIKIDQDEAENESEETKKEVKESINKMIKVINSTKGLSYYEFQNICSSLSEYIYNQIQDKNKDLTYEDIDIWK